MKGERTFMHSLQSIQAHQHNPAVLRARLVLGGPANESIVATELMDIANQCAEVMCLTNLTRNTKNLIARQLLEDARTSAVLVCAALRHAKKAPDGCLQFPSKNQRVDYNEAAINEYERMIASLDYALLLLVEQS
jgi:hypothetical protein